MVLNEQPPILVHASDLHLGAHLDDRLDAFVAAVKILAPTVTILTGDLTDGGREGEYRLVEALLKRLPGKVFLVPGNHDAPVNDLIARFTAPYQRFRRLRGAGLDFRGTGVAVASLRTAEAVQGRLDWSKGTVPVTRARSAMALLSPGRGRHWRVVAGHHPLIDPPGTVVPGNVRGGAAAYAMAETHGVDLALAGHTHQSFVGMPGDNRSLLLGIAPTLSSPRLRGEAQGFHVYTLQPDWLETAIWRWKETDFEIERTVTIARRAAD